jgi:hypothetical protein
MSWRQAQEYEFSQSSLRRGYRDNGESWSGQAQAWIDLFDFAWGMRNETEHGADVETQRRFERPSASAPFAVFISLGVLPITKGTPP